MGTFILLVWGILALVYLFLLIFIIVKFLQLVKDVELIRIQLFPEVVKMDWTKEFKYLVCFGEKEKAKELLLNEMKKDIYELFSLKKEEFFNVRYLDIKTKWSPFYKMIGEDFPVLSFDK